MEPTGDSPRNLERDLLAPRVKELRRKRGWNQNALAYAMALLGFGWKQKTVSDLEAGDRSVSVGELVGLSLAFDVPVSRLLSSERDDILWGLPPESDHWISLGNEGKAEARFRDVIDLLRGEEPTEEMVSAIRDKAVAAFDEWLTLLPKAQRQAIESLIEETTEHLRRKPELKGVGQAVEGIRRQKTTTHAKKRPRKPGKQKSTIKPKTKKPAKKRARAKGAAR